MPDGRQATLAGTLIGPSRHASHTPPTSVAPVREWTIRRHTTFLGTPLSRNSMLVPHEVAVSLAVALTCVARSEPVSTMPAAVGCWVPAGASQSPVRRPAAAAQAAAAVQRHCPPEARRLVELRGTGLITVTGRMPEFGRMLGGTFPSRPGNGAIRASSAWHARQV